MSMRIGIVNDVRIAVEGLRRALVENSDHRVAWIASSGEEAIAMCAHDKPDLVLMDLVMPGMGGVEATRQIMRDSPCPILIVATSIDSKRGSVFEAIGQGALDAVEMPPFGVGGRGAVAPLLARIDTVRRLLGDHETPAKGLRARPSWLLAIGASAGGPAAVATLLANLPVGLPAAIVIVQHIDAHFAAGMADWLGQQSRWPVRLAVEGDRLTVGAVLLAGTADHLVFKTAERLGYTADPADTVYRPSIDALFHSITQHCPDPATGVLLTGMGRDGALGLKAMRCKGYHTIAQDQATSAVYGMPRAAARIDAATDILALAEIAPRLVQLFSRRT
jgi:two-component system response regulator WspF